MTAKNDITGDSIQSRVASQKYIDNYDRIFRRNEVKDEIPNDSINRSHVSVSTESREKQNN